MHRAYISGNETPDRDRVVENKQEPRLMEQYVINKESKCFVSRRDLLSHLSRTSIKSFVKIAKKTKHNLIRINNVLNAR